MLFETFMFEIRIATLPNHIIICKSQIIDFIIEDL